jgi:hypothetical protein
MRKKISPLSGRLYFDFPFHLRRGRGGWRWSVRLTGGILTSTRWFAPRPAT